MDRVRRVDLLERGHATHDNRNSAYDYTGQYATDIPTRTREAVLQDDPIPRWSLSCAWHASVRAIVWAVATTVLVGCGSGSGAASGGTSVTQGSGGDAGAGAGAMAGSGASGGSGSAGAGGAAGPSCVAAGTYPEAACGLGYAPCCNDLHCTSLMGIGSFCSNQCIKAGNPKPLLSQPCCDNAVESGGNCVACTQEGGDCSTVGCCANQDTTCVNQGNSSTCTACKKNLGDACSTTSPCCYHWGLACKAAACCIMTNHGPHQCSSSNDCCDADAGVTCNSGSCCVATNSTTPVVAEGQAIGWCCIGQGSCLVSNGMESCKCCYTSYIPLPAGHPATECCSGSAHTEANGTQICN